MWPDERWKITPLWREASLQVKKLKAPHIRITFGSWAVEKVHPVVAPQSTCPCTKHTMLGALLEVEMSKKCTPLWLEAHFQVKMYKTPHARSTCGSWDVEKCTPLWREAHFQVNMYKAHHARSNFGSWDVEKVHAVVARSTFPSQHVQSTPCSEQFWKLRCRKSTRRCGAKHMSKSTCTKTPTSEHFWKLRCRKVHAVVARSTFPSQKWKKSWRVRSTFGRSHVVSRGRRKGLCTLSKVSKIWGFCSSFNYNQHDTPLHYSYNCNHTVSDYTTLH